MGNLVTDEELEQEKLADFVKAHAKKQTLDIRKVKDSDETEESFIDSDIVKETEEEIAKDIPSSYIPIELTSNGRIEGVPSILHFRCPSASDTLDISVPDENEKPKAIAKVLTRLNFEKFDILKLPIQDVLHILYALHGTFISQTIDKEVYVNPFLPDGNEEGELDNPKNIDEVSIPISSISYVFLGKDKDDNDLKENVRVPFKITDPNGNIAKFRFPILEDSIVAEKYCKNYYKDEFIRFADVKRAINNIRKIRDEKEQEIQMDNYLTENEEKANEYYEFMEEYALRVAKIVQAMQVVEYQGKTLETLEEKWKAYEEIPVKTWSKYSEITEKYNFGLLEEVKVFIPKLKKTEVRRVSFQLSDFLQSRSTENTDGYSVSFD